jgi:signal transduction histidine kinase
MMAQGEAMKKAAVVALVVMASVILSVNGLAESSIKDECVTLCKEAAKFVNEKGFYPAVAEINNKEGKVVTKNTYVFMMDLEGHLIAHPFNPQFIGRDITGTKDTNGKLFNQESIEIAKTKGEGWSEYMYPTPEELKKPTPFKENKSSKKISFVYRVPGKDLIVIAGFFE